jgi:prepilin-type N-terminal cleavage/methylation domain-containing protein
MAKKRFERIVKLHSIPMRTAWSAPARRPNQRAFTLAEVIIAVMVLGILITALYGAFSFGFTVVRVNQESVRADQILVEQLEQVRYYDWALVTNAAFIPSNFNVPFSTLGGTQGVTYSGSTSVSNAPVTESYGNTLRQVTVSVSWVSSGQPRTRSMTTLVSQNGISNFRP